MSYFDIFKCCSVNNHLTFVRQYCLVFLFLSLFHFYFWLGPKPICLPIFSPIQVQDRPKRDLQQQAIGPRQNKPNAWPSLHTAQLTGQHKPKPAARVFSSHVRPIVAPLFPLLHEPAPSFSLPCMHEPQGWHQESTLKSYGLLKTAPGDTIQPHACRLSCHKQTASLSES